jgi:hypothetical protein
LGPGTEISMPVTKKVLKFVLRKDTNGLPITRETIPIKTLKLPYILEYSTASCESH